MHPLLRYLSFLQHHKSSLPINHITRIHSQLISNALTQSHSAIAPLVELYCASSSPRYANLLVAQFYRQKNERNPYLLNVLIKCSPPTESILIFANWGWKAQLDFDEFTYIFSLGACARRDKSLQEGIQIHGRVVKHGFHSNVMLQTTLIHFYVQHNAFAFAQKVFDEMPVRTSPTWNSLISGYCSSKNHPRHGLLLFMEMLVQVDGIKPNDTTMVCILSAVSRLGYLETGLSIHCHIIKTISCIENDYYIGTGLIDMYAKCGCLDSALKLFNKMEHKNVSNYTAMVSGLAINGKGKQAIKIFTQMTESNVLPNSVTFTSLLFACSQSGLVEEGLYLFNILKKRFQISPLPYHYGCIVDLLARFGHLDEAYEFIINEKVEDDEVLWRSLLHGCRIHDNVVMGERVGKILVEMNPEMNCEDYVGLSNICASAGRWEDVAGLRQEMDVKEIEMKPALSTVLV